ncbi:MAG: hypothetical protein GY938_30990 [Ketobacter sp.]|nr:hypothetical protein [Ketobacter sp.]
MNAKWDWDTKSNREAEAGSDAYSVTGASRNTDGSIDWLGTARQAAASSEEFITSHLRHRWARSYAAFQSRHFDQSKYNSKRYRGRSSLFRPKTRMAIRKSDASVGAAFFATHDIVQITAENDADPLQLDGAKLQHEILNMRLDRTNQKYGIQWFLNVIGAHQNAKITGICCSKQEWIYEEKTVGYRKVEYLDPATGELHVVDEPITKKVKNKPDVTLFPSEMCLRDPSAHWIDQAQRGSYVILKYPETIGDVKARMNLEEGSSQKWNKVEDGEISKSIINQDNAGIRRSREGKGQDRYDNNFTNIRDFETVWVHENFIRMDGTDMHFWTLGTNTMLTEPRPVEEVYPEQQGLRPIVIGYGQVEAHKPDPQSAVESWQPLQQETNDIVNLRLDNVKQNMSPITKVLRGRNVDISQVQNRSPDSVILMNDHDDVEWDRPPDVSASAYAEMDRINVDLDDLAGTFSSSSVQSNRQMNETVGGMNLMNASANSLGEFDIRVFNETWIEPVLRQLCNLNAYYEDDPKILSIAGAKAGLWDQYIEGMTDLDGLLMQTVQLRVDAGMGASDPMQRLQKIRMGAETVAIFGGPQVQQMVNLEAVIEEVFGILGYKDGKRFFNVEGPDPQVQQMTEQLQMAMEEIKKLELKLEDGGADRENAVLLERIKSATKLISEVMQTERDKFQGAIQQSSQILTHNANTQATKQRADQAGARNQNNPQEQGKKKKMEAFV